MRMMADSLCESCRHAREVRTARSRFLLCEQSVTNDQYVKYPPQPIERCEGYQRILNEPIMTKNLLHDLPATLPQELVQTLIAANKVRIERIVSHGHASPAGFWYDQDEHEWVVVLKGSARIRFEGQDPIELKPCDFINIPAHQRHRVDWTTPDEPTIWLAVHYGETL